MTEQGKATVTKPEMSVLQNRKQFREGEACSLCDLLKVLVTGMQQNTFRKHPKCPSRHPMVPGC